MITIVSKRHILKFYFSIIFGTLFFLWLGIMMFVIYDKPSRKKSKIPTEILPLIGVASIAFSGYSLMRYIKNAPSIRIDENFISFNDQSYSLSDIEWIDFTGKRPFKYAVNFPMEAATLKFRNGEHKYIFDDMYANIAEMKNFLYQTVTPGKKFSPGMDGLITSEEIVNESFETFKGMQLTSLRGISLWVVIAFAVYGVVTSNRANLNGLILGMSLFSLFSFLIHSYFMHYFQVSGRFLLVKNHNLFWKKKAYRLNNIKEVTFETQGKWPNCLRVITKDFKAKLYPAGTLRDSTWKNLKDKLESHGIEVRNECIIIEN